MASMNDPRLLYSVPNIRASHIQHGEESSLTPSGPQTLSLLLVPTSHEHSDPDLVDDSREPGSRPESPEVDFYLHLHLPPEVDIPMPATTQVFHQPPNSYIIPRWDLGPESGAFTRIEFPKIGSGPDRVSQEDIDTFETILAQCTAFAEKAKAPQSKAGKAYNPSDYQPGEGYVGKEGSSGKISSVRSEHGQIVLIDEEDGSVVGELGEGYHIDESSGVKPGDKTPVEIEMPQGGAPNRISVRPVSDEYLEMSRHPAYARSKIVQNAAMASRLIVTGSTGLSRAITSGAHSFTEKTKPAAKPLTFSPATQEHIRKINNLTHGAVGLSAATIGSINKYAQNLGARLSRKEESKQARGNAPSGGVDKHGRPLPKADFKPSILNKSLIAFNTIADSLQESAKQILDTGGAAGAHMVNHRYGPDAGRVAGHLTGSVRHVGLVFIDAQGVSRRAVLKTVAKGMVVGRMPNGEQVLVGDGDGGVVPADASKQPRNEKTGSAGIEQRSGTPNSALEAARLQANARASAASGGGAPPAYSDLSGVGGKVSDAKH